MVSYFITAMNDESENAVVISVDEMKPCAVSASRIERMKMTVKAHRAAIDFDKSLCSCTVRVKKEKKIIDLQ